MNRPFLAAACAFGILSGGSAKAQTLVGTVRGGGAPIVGATVRLLELERVQHTGATGQFTFADVPAGTYRVFVAVIGYASVTDTVRVTEGTTRVTFDLRQSAVPLKEVVVSAPPDARTTGDVYQPTASKSQVDFLNSSGSSFAEKISDLPGVAVRGNGSAPSRPVLRGLSENEVLVLENGLRMGDIATYDPAHATPVAAICVSQVGVVRVPATILYGPSTIGGIVNVITDIVPVVSDHATSGTAAVEGNSVNNEGAAYVNNVYSSGGQAFRLSGGLVRASSTQIPPGSYTDPGTGAVFRLNKMPQTFQRSGEVGAGYSYQGGFGTIGIGGKHFEMNYGIPGVPPNADFINVPPTTSRIDQRRTTLEMRSLFHAGSGVAKQIRINAAYNDYDHSEFPTAQDSSGVSASQANHFHKREFNGVMQVLHRPIGRLQGTLGLWTNIENLTIDGDMPLGPNSVTTGLAGYAYEEYLATETTRLQAGLRYDYNKIQTNPFAASTDSVFRTLDASRQSNAVTASVGAIRQLTSRLAGSFSVARSFRAPTVQELFANGLDAASATYSIGTASLGPETGLGVDVAVKGDFTHVAFELSPFVNYVHDFMFGFLRGDTIQGFPVRQFTATNARLAGFEASVTLQPTQSVALQASSDYVRAQDTKQNTPFPFTPPLGVLRRGTYQSKTYRGMAEWRGAASQTRLGEGDSPTGGYAIMNLGAGLRLVHHGGVD